MTQDLDQSLEFIAAALLVIFLLPFALAWLDETLDRPDLGQSVMEGIRHVTGHWRHR